MKIYKVDKVTDKITEAFARLLPQLSSSLETPSKEFLQEVIDMEGSTIFLAEEDNVILGSISLVIYKIPTGKKARIEDVVVDDAARGKGVAMQLMQAAIRLATDEGIEKLDLTSNPSRKAAHALYYKCGFEERDTGVFRLKIKQ